MYQQRISPLPFLYFIITLISSHFTYAAIINYDEMEFDLNKDLKMEKMLLSKKLGLDLVQILSSSKDLLFEHEFTPMGKSSKFAKISQVIIDSEHQCLLLYYFQGVTGVSSPKKSSRLLSLCYKVSNLKDMQLQDLGYTSWDYLGVSSFLKLEGVVNINKYIFYGKIKTLLTLSSDERKRAWEFNINDHMWKNLPENKYANYHVIPAR